MRGLLCSPPTVTTASHRALSASARRNCSFRALDASMSAELHFRHEVFQRFVSFGSLDCARSGQIRPRVRIFLNTNGAKNRSNSFCSELSKSYLVSTQFDTGPVVALNEDLSAFFSFALSASTPRFAGRFIPSACSSRRNLEKAQTDIAGR